MNNPNQTPVKDKLKSGPPSKWLTDPEFQEHVRRLFANETTRDKICGDLGITKSQLSVRLRRCDLVEKLREAKINESRPPESAWFKPDLNPAYARAVADALARPAFSVTAICKAHPGTEYRTLARRIKEARAKVPK